jgi:tRNA threonylcarbamoyladenosine biosynthesis protein TsaE
VSDEGAHDYASGAWITTNPEDTFELGARIGRSLLGGELFLLNGPLGAGKTLFAKGIAAGLGIDPDDVSSPSFTLVNRYDGRLRMYHLDLYRLSEGPAAAFAVDLDELLNESDAVVLIEWGDRLGGYRLPAGVRKIIIEGDGDDERHITLSQD